MAPLTWRDAGPLQPRARATARRALRAARPQPARPRRGGRRRRLPVVAATARTAGRCTPPCTRSPATSWSRPGPLEAADLGYGPATLLGWVSTWSATGSLDRAAGRGAVGFPLRTPGALRNERRRRQPSNGCALARERGLGDPERIRLSRPPSGAGSSSPASSPAPAPACSTSAANRSVSRTRCSRFQARGRSSRASSTSSTAASSSASWTRTRFLLRMRRAAGARRDAARRRADPRRPGALRAGALRARHGGHRGGCPAGSACAGSWRPPGSTVVRGEPDARRSGRSRPRLSARAGRVSRDRIARALGRRAHTGRRAPRRPARHARASERERRRPRRTRSGRGCTGRSRSAADWSSRATWRIDERWAVLAPLAGDVTGLRVLDVGRQRRLRRVHVQAARSARGARDRAVRRATRRRASSRRSTRPASTCARSAGRRSTSTATAASTSCTAATCSSTSPIRCGCCCGCARWRTTAARLLLGTMVDPGLTAPDARALRQRRASPATRPGGGSRGPARSHGMLRAAGWEPAGEAPFAEGPGHELSLLAARAPSRPPPALVIARGPAHGRGRQSLAARPLLLAGSRPDRARARAAALAGVAAGPARDARDRLARRRPAAAGQRGLRGAGAPRVRRRETDDPTEYFTANDQYPALDAWLLEAMLTHLRPRRMIEVGSGFSSLVTARVNRERFAGVDRLHLHRALPAPVPARRRAGHQRAARREDPGHAAGDRSRRWARAMSCSSTRRTRSRPAATSRGCSRRCCRGSLPASSYMSTTSSCPATTPSRG